MNMLASIKVEGGPTGRLVLTHRSYDWNVVLGIGRVQQRVESAGPGRYLASHGIELLLCELALGKVVKGQQLTEAEHAQRGHVLAGGHGLKAHKRNLHGQNGAEHVHGRVGHVQPVRKPSHNHQDQNVQRN
ncbi:hypothetical protein BpHYR1_034396 [Brachionus plicatilis]|uniref:Uncharacterized protein n=1 Tax=Brachionus plicatilis TaxID=10195 RepID=A0A3M7SW44_BRAPC|nr:hypothetical protein BpHYR1_034396 [Brachionus plicatilis]